MEIVATIRYERLNPIGVGQGMNSQVFLVNDPQLQGRLAVKEIPKGNFGNNLAAYFDEAKAMFAVTHPNIIPIQYACERPQEVCLAMPYYPVGSLAQRIQTGPLRLKELLQVGDEVLRGLGKIHQKNYLHLDLKPTNILFSDRMAAMIADFGQAREITNGVVTALPRMYVWSFPPETLQQRVAVLQSDIFQVGLLLYRAVNGDGFYRAQMPSPADLPTMICKGRFPSRDRFQPHVPRRVRTIIRKALKVDPSDRYQSATDMAADLARVNVPLDWQMSSTAASLTSWRAQRLGQPDLLVELVPNGGLFDVQCWTARGSDRRARGRTELWRSKVALADGELHLKEVFATLQA